MNKKFRPVCILISAISIFLLVSGTAFSQDYSDINQIETKIAKIQEEIIKIKTVLEEIIITELKSKISKIEKEISEKQAILEKAKEVGIAITAEIPTWIIKGLVAPETFEEKAAAIATTTTATITEITTSTTTATNVPITGGEFQIPTQITIPTETLPTPTATPTIPILTLAAQTVSISSTNYPKFKQAIIDPLEVRVYDTQNMIVTVEDPNEVDWVRAEIEHDLGKDTVSLGLAEGDLTSGKWVGIWVVHDTVSKTYRTTFIARNKKGDENSTILAWSDPCSPTASGTWALDGNCSIGGVSGVENGNFTISSSYTLTILATGTWAMNSGYTTTNSGTISIVKGGTMRKTNLWMVDADSDGYSASTTQYAQDSAPTNGRRRYSMTSLTSLDYNDANATIYPGTDCGNDCSINNTNGTCGVRAQGEHDLAACKECDGNSSTSVNIDEGQQDTEGTNLCNTNCKACNGSGSCVNYDTGWGDGQYGCTGTTKRCSSGSCITCGGYIADDGCGGCSGQGGDTGCWYAGALLGQSCNTVCTNGCVAQNWNDDASCNICKHYYPAGTCAGAGATADRPAYSDANNNCRYRAAGTNQDCAYADSARRRFCICNY